MALTGTLLADFSGYTAAVEQAVVQLKSFQSGAGNVERALGRMGDSFSGRKVLQDAALAAKAVDSIGGASKLTASELARVGATAQEAVEKMKALGVEVPRDIQALAAHANTATNSFSNMKSVVSTLAGAFGVAFTIGAVVNFGKELLHMGDEIVRVHDRTGLTIKEVQQFTYVAAQSGNTIEELTGAIGQMQNRLSSGDKSAVQAVKELGLNLHALTVASPAEQMGMIAAAIGRISDPAVRAAEAMDLFGKSGAAILPTLTSDFERLAKAAPQMSEATVRSLDTAGDAIGRFGTAIKVMAAEAVVKFLEIGPPLERLAFWMAGMKAPTAAFNVASAMLSGTQDRLTDTVHKTAEQLAAEAAAAKTAAAALLEANKAAMALFAEQERQRAFGNQWGIFNSMNITQTGGLAALLARGKVAMVPDLLPTGEDFTRYLAGVMPTALKAAGAASGPSFSEALFKDFGGTITRAFEGGGNVLKSIGSTLGGNLTQHMFGKGSGMAESISKHFSGALGEAFNAILPGIGAIAGPLLSKLAGLFGNLFGGPDAKEKAGRSLSDTFASSMASSLDWMQQIEVHQLVAQGNSEKWAETVVGVRDAYIKAGHSVDEALSIVDRLFKAEKLGGTAVQQVIDEITRAMHDTVPAFDAAGVAGVGAFASIEDAAASAAAAAAASAETAYNAWARTYQYMNAGGSGVDPTRGALSPENYASYEDYKRAFLQFNPGDEHRLAGAIASNSVVPSWAMFASGSGGMRDFGSGTLAMLHGREAVVPEGQSGAGLSRRLELTMNAIDRRLKDLPRLLTSAMLKAQA